MSLLLVSASLSGRLADPPPGEAQGPTGPGSTVVGWDLLGCTALVWFVPADAEAVAAELPAGFTPRGAIGLPVGQAPPGADAYLGFEAFTCDTGQGLDGPVQGMTYATVFTSVDPPENLRVDGVGDQHYYKWRVLVPDLPRRDLLQDAGVPAVDGTVDLAQPVPGVWSATVDLQGLGTITIDGPAQGEPQPTDAEIPFAEFTQATSGMATWQATASDISRTGGTGAWTVPEGSWMADVLGASQGAARFNLNLWSFADASIRLPGR